MRKQVFGRRFRRDKNERQALFKSLISAMILQGNIKTTEQKAKAIKGDVDKLITKAKKGETARYLLQPYLKYKEIEKMINEIAPSFAKRNGGYTRIVRLGNRFSDNASMVMLQWADREVVQKEKPKKKPVNKAVIAKPAITKKVVSKKRAVTKK